MARALVRDRVPLDVVGLVLDHHEKQFFECVATLGGEQRRVENHGADWPDDDGHDDVTTKDRIMFFAGTLDTRFLHHHLVVLDRQLARLRGGVELAPPEAEDIGVDGRDKAVD